MTRIYIYIYAYICTVLFFIDSLVLFLPSISFSVLGFVACISRYAIDPVAATCSVPPLPLILVWCTLAVTWLQWQVVDYQLARDEYDSVRSIGGVSSSSGSGSEGVGSPPSPPTPLIKTLASPASKSLPVDPLQFVKVPLPTLCKQVQTELKQNYSAFT